MLAPGALGQCRQVGDADHRLVHRKRQALDHTGGHPHPGKGPRAAAEHQRIHLCQSDTCLTEDLLDHRQQQLGMQARSNLGALVDLPVMQQGSGAGFGGGIQGKQGNSHGGSGTLWAKTRL